MYSRARLDGARTGDKGKGTGAERRGTERMDGSRCGEKDAAHSWGSKGRREEKYLGLVSIITPLEDIFYCRPPSVPYSHRRVASRQVQLSGPDPFRINAPALFLVSPTTRGMNFRPSSFESRREREKREMEADGRCYLRLWNVRDIGA